MCVFLFYTKNSIQTFGGRKDNKKLYKTLFYLLSDLMSINIEDGV